MRIAAVLTLAVTGSIHADTFVVNPDGTGDYLTLTSAATWAPDGSIIAIADGNYSEAITIVGRTLTFEPLLEGGSVHWLLPAGSTDWAALHATNCILTVNDIVFDGVDATHVDATGLFIGAGVSSFSGVTAARFHSGMIVQIGSGHGCSVANCQLIENNSGIVLSLGGASGPVMQISACTFSDNGSTGAGSLGSGLRVVGVGPGEVMLDACNFSGNEAFIGGAILHDAQAELSVESTSFHDNLGSNRAGAVFLNNFGGSAVEFTACTFASNVAMGGVGGGAIYVDGDPAQIQTLHLIDCLFQGNTASGAGGAIHIQHNQPSVSDFLIQGTSFIDNAADVGGGVFAGSGSQIGVQDAFFCSNAPDHIDATWTDLGGNLFVDTCSQGACCFDTGGTWSCTSATLGGCETLGGTFHGVGVACDDIVCDGPATGACCLSAYCWEVDQASCEGLSGVWNAGDRCIDIVCEDSVCATIRPCCLDTTCIMATEQDCNDADGAWDSIADKGCAFVICLGDPSCPEDIDGSGDVEVNDLLQLIAAWGPCP